MNYDKSNQELLQRSNQFFVVTSILLVFLYKLPHKIHLMIPLFLLYTLINTSDISTSVPVYTMSEYYISSLGMMHCLVIIIPTQWRSNSIAYAVGMGYHLYSVHMTYGEVKPDTIISLVFSCFWFTLCNFVLYSKLKSLYS